MPSSRSGSSSQNAGRSSAASKKTDRLHRRPAIQFLGHVVAECYYVNEIIGTGGMGTVYGALDVRTGREVALKALHARVFTTESLRRFRREAESASRVRHPHMCEVRHLGIAKGTPFIVMERLRGETLKRRLDEEGPLAAADAVTILIQMLDALAAAHAVGVLHRDVKPANVLITTPRGQSPWIKIIDFGLARFLPQARARGGEEATAITGTDVIAGTPSYMAPEQIAAWRDLDERVDVWAAGVTLYEILAGHRPFSGASYAQLASEIVFGKPPPPLSNLRPDLPRSIDAIVARAVERRRELRYRTTADFRDDLVTAWARHRAEGLSRGAQLRRPGRE
jgi:eukaryotic-like serine/threonine-protein kinase